MQPALRAVLVCIGLALPIAVVLAKADTAEIDFSLIDHEGKPFHLRDLRGKVVLVFFGYTLCPDVCPLELQHMATALKRLGDDSKHARGLFVTLDPDHDRPEVLRQYMDYFDGGLIGLTGTLRQTDRVAKQFRVIYEKNPGSANQYTMDHTANLFVLDRSGKLTTIVPFGFPASHIETMLRDMIGIAK